MHEVDFEEWQLTSLFEVEPEYEFPDDPWPYRGVTYTVKQEPLSLRFSLNAGIPDASIQLFVGGNMVFQFVGLSLANIEYIKDKTGESLRLTISESSSIELRVKPHIRISHNVENHP